MPIDRNRLDRMIGMMDDYLAQLEQDKLNGYDDSEDEDTDPIQFLAAPRKLPVSEPPAEPTEDSAPSRIHGSPKHDLFK